jgi:hypothetical protein
MIDKDDAADLIRDILEAYAEYLEANEPYATRSINEARNIAMNIDEIIDEVTSSD